MKRLTRGVLVLAAAGALFGCEIDTGDGDGREDANTGAGGGGADNGAGGGGAAGAGGAGAEGGAGGAGAAGGAGGAGAEGGVGGAGAAGGAGGVPAEGCGDGPACAEGQRCRDGRCIDEGCGCEAVFEPVCGADGVTYGNACEADCAGMLVAYEGECRQPPACPDPNDPNVHYVSDSPERCAGLRFVCEEGQEAFNNECGCGCIGPVVGPACGPDRPCPEGQICREGACVRDEGCVCPDIFAPVCGADGRTYGNECEARCAGVRIAYEGECREVACGPDRPCPEGQVCREGACVPGEGCVCPDVYMPVCGADGRTYGNACEARCAGVRVAYEGECREPACGPDRPCPEGQRCVEGICIGAEPCVCPDIFAPVCGADGRTYGNECEARCAGVRIAYEGECREPECPDPNDPNVHYVSDNPERCAVIRFVCEEGQEAFSNACGCGCIGRPVEPACGPDRPCPRGQICREGQCVPNECICPAIFAPVCGVDGVTYENACRAGCAGVAIAYEGECRAPECGPDRPCPRGQQCAEGRCIAVEPCVCPDIFAPVCGVDGVTYPNECTARCARVAVAYVGECREPVCGPDRPCPRGQVCEAGQCVPVVVCPEGPNYRYVAHSPAECQAVRFVCEEPAQQFFNDCGCGCMVPEGQCLPEACGPERLPPIVICPDGSQGGPTGRCIQGAAGDCSWEIRECPDVQVCGGIVGARCDRGERCEHPVGTCRVADGQGACLPIPEVCNRIFMPVCGCDGVTYGNDCERQRAGAQKDYDGECRNVRE